MSGASVLSFGELGEVRAVVDLAAAGDDLDEVDVHLGDPVEVFGVAGDDPRTELAEAFAGEGGIVVEAFGGVDAVAYVDVDAEAFAVDGFEEPHVFVRTGGNRPAHHFDGEAGAFGFDGVDDAAAVFDCGIKEVV